MPDDSMGRGVLGGRLREVAEGDVAAFFEHQRDPIACFMAAFTADDPSDRVAFEELWARILANDRIVTRTIVLDDGTIAGNIVHFQQYGLPAIGYWIAPAQWGRGIASRAVADFLTVVNQRPLYARIAFDNHGSRRVLEKCGFRFWREERGYAAARRAEIVECVYVLS